MAKKAILIFYLLLTTFNGVGNEILISLNKMYV